MNLIVLLLSLGAVGGILWWFFGKHQTSFLKAELQDGVQKVTIIVDGGYKPETVQLKVGVPAEVTFLRKSPSSCFEEVLLPDFGQQAKLAVGEPKSLSFTPTKTGVFTYSCGMHMFFGRIEVVA